MNWVRVNRQARCPMCGKDHWCLLLNDGTKAICMKVQSNRPFHFKGGETGYIHDLAEADRPKYIPAPEPRPTLNVRAKLDEWTQWNRKDAISGLAADLGVSVSALNNLECVKAPYHRVFAFPMKDGYGEYTGIRLRHENGEKWAERGSHSGIFLPTHLPNRGSRTLALITEGPTDTAAALTLGYYAIGRPSCSGGLFHIVNAIRHRRITRAAVVADNDDPGLEGATTLCNHLPCDFCILVLPSKDLRDFVRNGGTAQLLNAIMDGQIWRRSGTTTAQLAHQPTE